jgi:hypothetical protein
MAHPKLCAAQFAELQLCADISDCNKVAGSAKDKNLQRSLSLSPPWLIERLCTTHIQSPNLKLVLGFGGLEEMVNSPLSMPDLGAPGQF